VSSRLRHLVPDLELVRKSAIVLSGFSVARLLGFLFSVAAARVLAPADFGRMTYVLAVAAIASVLISAAPCGLSRFLAQHHNEETIQEDYFSNWLTVVGLLLATSLVVALPLAAMLGLNGWMVVGVAANLLGVTVFESYKEVLRGLDRFTSMALCYGLANLLQLLAIVGAARLGWRSPALFVIVYGVSGLAACAILQSLAPVRLRFLAAATRRRRMLEVVRFIRPLLLQSVFFAVWLSADLILVQRILGATATGNYGAAKTLANAVWLAPAAIGTVLVPRVARLPEAGLRHYLPRVVALAALVTVPAAAGLVVFGRPVTELTFGSRYSDAVAPLAVLGLGMALHGLYMVPFGLWIGLGRPTVDMVSTGVGMALTVIAAMILVPVDGLLGAAAAFAIGSAARLMVIGGFTVWALYVHPAPASGTVPDAFPVVLIAPSSAGVDTLGVRVAR
jgi:O-antigen/teichoic acid export membrane protein